MNLQRLKQYAQALHGSALGPLHKYYSFQLSSFMGFLNMKMSGSLILVHSLRDLLFFYWLGLFNFDMKVFVLS